MKNWKAVAGSLVLAGALAAPGMSLASGGGGHHHGPHHSKHRMFQHMAEKLELTEGQKAQLKADRDANREAQKAQREKRREIHKQLREAIESGADQATLDQLGAELGKLQVARMQAMHEQHRQFEAILTDEQKTKLEQMRAERKARWEERRTRRTERRRDDR